MILSFSQSNIFLIAILWATLVGVVSAFNMSLSRGMIQVKVDDEMRGRVMSIDMMLHRLAPVGILPLGLLAEFAGVPLALAVGGGLMLIGFSLLALLLPEVRKIDER